MSEEEKKDTATEAPVEEKKEETPVEEVPVKEEKKETPTDDKKEDEGEEVEVPKKFKTLVDEIESMSVLDLHELVKLLEKKFGVSAAAMAVAAPGAAGAEGGDEKSEFNVELKSPGDQKIAVIKVIKEALGLGLKEAKDLVDSAPVILKEGLKTEEAEELKKQLETAGGSVELK